MVAVGITLRRVGVIDHEVGDCHDVRGTLEGRWTTSPLDGSWWFTCTSTAPCADSDLTGCLWVLVADGGCFEGANDCAVNNPIDCGWTPVDSIRLALATIPLGHMYCEMSSVDYSRG